MNKQEFLAELRRGLSGLPRDDIEERLSFYGEMLDDRIEEGLTEEEAVSAAGPVDEIVRQTVVDIPLAKIAKERIRPKRRLRAWETVLLVLGSPVWLSLGIAAAAAVFAVYAAMWAVIAALWAVFGALAVCAVAGVPGCIIFAAGGSVASGLALLGGGLVCAGLSVFMFFGCKKATAGIMSLTKKFAIWIKNCFKGKEAAK